jgi:hypothetical protein
LVMTNLGLRILGEQRVIVHESVRRLFLKYIIEYLMFRPILVFLLKQIIEL